MHNAPLEKQFSLIFDFTWQQLQSLSLLHHSMCILSIIFHRLTYFSLFNEQLILLFFSKSLTSRFIFLFQRRRTSGHWASLCAPRCPCRPPLPPTRRRSPLRSSPRPRPHRSSTRPTTGATAPRPPPTGAPLTSRTRQRRPGHPPSPTVTRRRGHPSTPSR